MRAAGVERKEIDDIMDNAMKGTYDDLLCTMAKAVTVL
jgi:hypothetical protein